ncbi:hypothetical protein JCM39068_41160 [Desulfocastanea catecholica]
MNPGVILQPAMALNMHKTKSYIECQQATEVSIAQLVTTVLMLLPQVVNKMMQSNLYLFKVALEHFQSVQYAIYHPLMHQDRMAPLVQNPLFLLVFFFFY